MTGQRFVICHTGEPPPGRVLAALAPAGAQFTPLSVRGTDPAVRLAGLRPDGYLVNDPQRGSPYLSAGLIGAAGNLKIVTYMGETLTAEDYAPYLDLEALSDRRIVVTTTPGPAISVAEGTITLLCALNLGLLPANAARKEGRPVAAESRAALHGSVLGIVGMGQIGTRVAHLAAALGMRITYFSRHRHRDVEDELAASFAGLHELFERSAHVSIHASYSLARGLIGRDVLARAHGSNLINTADPSIVPPGALLEALDTGWIRRAAVEGRYPGPYDQRLRELPDDRLIMLPFTSWNTQHTGERNWDAYIESMLAFLHGNPVPHRLA
jgi:phosphoglycerate dehydrogenase-like enzyme